MPVPALTKGFHCSGLRPQGRRGKNRLRRKAFAFAFVAFTMNASLPASESRLVLRVSKHRE
jgi:hypothetical protein